MTDSEKIERLEKHVADMEIRLTARMDAVLLAITAAQGVTVDALALIALRDRALVENLLKFRRLEHQTSGGSPISREMLKRYESALEIADGLTSAGPLRPR
jgi:hypothetical protein